MPEALPTSSRDADRIRQCALDNYIAPAQAAGLPSVTILVKELHDRLGLKQAEANVCQALAGKKLQVLAGVARPSIDGPLAGRTTKFTFQLSAIELDQCWFVGSSFGGTADQTQRFLQEGIWEIDTPSDSDAKLVRAMQVGDRIAMKAAFVQKLNLPFENHGVDVSVMRLKGRGVITANPGDGSHVSVDWDPTFEVRDWYFYTYLKTIWRVRPGKPLPDRLIAFTFADEPQDFDWFLAQGEWAKMYSDTSTARAKRFWIEKTIVAGRTDREEGEHALGKALWSPQRSKDGRDIYSRMLEVRPGDVVFHLTDNQAITDVSVVSSAADESFIGVEGTEWANQPGYRIALEHHEKLDPLFPREGFLETEPFSTELKELAESGARGLFYNSRRGLNQGAYLTEATPSLLSILNRAYRAYSGQLLPYALDEEEDQACDLPTIYTLDDALDGLFLEPEVAADILLLWRARKNVILQGPPGVGKSFAAQRLAFALMGMKDRSRLGFVQFHQSYSYEDFVEGFRPTASGFELKPGKFVEFCRRAEADPNGSYVFVIDEINRGNLSKILGELMLLLESDKRDPEWAMPLASGKAPFHVPSNVYILGLMNTADRSLAVVDYALRRRFAFVDLAPALASSKFRDHLLAAGVGASTIEAIVERVGALNTEIIGDVANLGPGFAIGHSFFCAGPMEGEGDENWYARVVRTEIAPLLREYWFDAPSKLESWTHQLMAAL